MTDDPGDGALPLVPAGLDDAAALERRGERAAPDELDQEAEQTLLGLELRPISPEMARQLGLRNAEGVLVAGVEDGSPADEAGVQRGDIIRELNRQRIKGLDDFERLSRNLKPGDRVTVLLQRGPMSLYVAFTLARG